MLLLRALHHIVRRVKLSHYDLPLIQCPDHRQLPSNMVLRRFGVRVCLTFYVISWGAVQLGMGFVKTWGTLTLCRVLLGVFEVSFSFFSCV